MIIRNNMPGAFNQPFAPQGGDQNAARVIQEIGGKLVLNTQIRDKLPKFNAKTALLTGAASVNISDEGKALSLRSRLRADEAYNADKSDLLRQWDRTSALIQEKEKIKEQYLGDFAKQFAGRVLTEEEQAAYEHVARDTEKQYDTTEEKMMLKELETSDAYQQERTAQIERGAVRDLEIGKKLGGEAAALANAKQDQKILAQQEKNDAIEGILAQLEGEKGGAPKKTSETVQTSPQTKPAKENKEAEKLPEEAEPKDKRHQSGQESAVRD